MGEDDKNVIYEDEFTHWAEAWEIDTDVDDMTEEDRDDFRGHKHKLINAMKRGRLVYKEDEDILEYTLLKSEGMVTIARPKGAGIMEADRYKQREGVHQTYAILGAMTGKPTNFFSNLDAIDLKPFLSVVSLFFGS